ncbi:MAG: adenylate/guanylate cyclase domain-containing protein [Pseudobdellovibrio sp.]
MNKNHVKNRLADSAIPFKKGVVITSVIYFLLALIYYSGGKDFIYNRVVHPLVFQIRNKTPYAGRLDPKIKIFGVDQQTMNSVNYETIPMKDWTALFTAFAKAKPKALFVDKAFLLALSTDDREIQDFNNSIRKLPESVAGAMITSAPVQGLIELPTQDIFKSDSAWPPASPVFTYGPRSEIAGSFSHIGHTNYEDNGYIKPFVRNQKGDIVPFWSLWAGKIEINNSGFSIDGENVPVDDENKILVNLSSLSNYVRSSYSLAGAVKNARAGNVIPDVDSESVVVLLTGMSLSNTIMKNTPAGTMPAGYILAEVINSILKKSWLIYVGYEPFFMALFCLAGWVLALLLDTRKFWLTLVLSEITLVAIAVAGFIFFRLMLPWAFPSLGFLFTGIAIFAEKSRVSEMKAKALQFSLEGMIEPEKLNQLMQNPELFRLEPRNENLTVMFIDIVGFSTMAEQESPAEVFKHLRELLGLASDIVHKSGGIIDRSLGDGLLCFFGYQFEQIASVQSNHAEDALNCAARIQTEILKRDLAAIEKGGVIFPMRIGINTGEVYVGDLGGGHKIDFTIIGHSVNFAQRLESACENYRVMCGAATRDFVRSDSSFKLGLVRKYISIKHHAELVESYEFDPFQHEPELQQKQKLLSRKINQSQRDDTRWPAPHNLMIRFAGNLGKGYVTNFSRSGLEIKSEAYIGKGAIVNFEFILQEKNTENAFKSSSIGEISAEVRWSWKDGDSSRLGLKFKNQSEDAKEIILETIRKIS